MEYNICQVNISEIDFSGIDTIKHKEISVKLDGNTIIVSGGDEIGVYDVSGNVVYYGKNIPVKVNAPGVYIVKTENIIKKIIFY